MAAGALLQKGALGGNKAGRERLQQWFLVSAGVILAVTGIAKLLSAGGDAGILSRPDPIFGIPFGRLLFMVGVTETLVACFCFLGRRPHLCTLAVTWLATGFLVYRIGIWMTGWQHTCGCLGNLTQALAISPQAADRITLGLLAYLLIGGYAALLLNLLRSRNAGAVALPSSRRYA
jgi:hypothetical protein